MEEFLTEFMKTTPFEVKSEPCDEPYDEPLDEDVIDLTQDGDDFVSLSYETPGEEENVTEGITHDFVMISDIVVRSLQLCLKHYFKYKIFFCKQLLMVYLICL